MYPSSKRVFCVVQRGSVGQLLHVHERVAITLQDRAWKLLDPATSGATIEDLRQTVSGWIGWHVPWIGWLSPDTFRAALANFWS